MKTSHSPYDHDRFTAKLVEEAQEAEAALRSGDRQEFLQVLADLAEVIDAVLAHQDTAPEAVRAHQQERRAARSGFDRRLRLLWVA